MGYGQVVEQVQGTAEALVAAGGQVARDVEVVVLSAYRVDAFDNEPVMGLRVDHLVESVFRQFASQLVDAVRRLDDVAVGSHPRFPETARRGDERVGQVQVGCEVAYMSGSPLSLYGFAFSALADGSRLYGIEALIYVYKRFDLGSGYGNANASVSGS